MRTDALTRGTCTVLALLVAVSILAPGTRAEDIEPLALGSPAPDFDLPAVQDRNYRLSDFAAARVLVVIFTCNHCPTAQAYEDRIIQLHKDYRERGVALVAISPNDPRPCVWTNLATPT